MDVKYLLGKLVECQGLETEETAFLFNEIIAGHVDDINLAGVLIALKNEERVPKGDI